MKYDVVIAGGGAAGSVLAGRLAANEHLSVLLLEAGPDYPDPANIPDDVKFGHTRFAEAPELATQLGLARCHHRGAGADPRGTGQGDRRRIVDQRPGHAARLPRGLRFLGGPRQRRMVVRQGGAVLPPIGARSRHQRQLLPWRRRSDAGPAASGGSFACHPAGVPCRLHTGRISCNGRHQRPAPGRPRRVALEQYRRRPHEYGDDVSQSDAPPSEPDRARRLLRPQGHDQGRQSRRRGGGKRREAVHTSKPTGWC